MEGMEDYIWRRRIHHAVRYQKGAVPFPAAVAAGLDFNAALARRDALDPALLTNGVMLDLCEFAKTVTRSGMYFLFEILDFNFELGVDASDDERCYNYARRLHNKAKLLRETVKLRPQRWRETFLLPDLATLTAPAQPERYYPKRNKMVDCSVLTDGSKTSLPADAASFVVRKYGGVKLRLTADAFPLCMDLGVALTIGDDAPKEKLNPDQITNGVVIELLDFSRVLCGTHTRIVQDLVRHNFSQELDGSLFRMHIARLMDRKYACVTAAARDAYLREAFQVQVQKRKRKTDIDADPQDLNRLMGASKRRVTLRAGDGDSSYMCPVEFEAEMPSDSETGPDQTGCLETTLLVDVKQEVETADLSPRRVNRRPPKTSLDLVSDLFFEVQNQDMAVKTQKQKLWTRRATRSKQILKSSRKNDMFACCREIGLDFNVASGLRWDLDLQRFTNRVLWEVYKFATAMTKSLRSFLFEILDHNFNLVLQDDVHRRNFMIYMITKEKILQNHPDHSKAEFLQRPFQFPEVYNMGDVIGEFQTGQGVDTEQLMDPDPPASATSQQGAPHPYCQKLGLDLWSAVERPASQKLDLAVLTTGAVLELFGFVRELCGSVREMVNEVLEHNFDLDLQNRATEASQAVLRWYVTQKSLMKRQPMSLKIHRWLNMVVLLNSPPQLSPQPAVAEDPKDLVSEDSKLENFSGDPEAKKGDPYHICREIGLDLDVASKRGAKTKLDLRVLTRGVLYELHQYVEQNCHRYVPSLYEILDYNFDLGPQNHRKVEVAWAVASQVVAIAGKTGRKGDYLNRVVVLPVQVSGSSLVCKDEPEDGFGDQDQDHNDDVLFVQELKPVDIEVMIE